MPHTAVLEPCTQIRIAGGVADGVWLCWCGIPLTSRWYVGSKLTLSVSHCFRTAFSHVQIVLVQAEDRHSVLFTIPQETLFLCIMCCVLVQQLAHEEVVRSVKLEATKSHSVFHLLFQKGCSQKSLSHASCVVCWCRSWLMRRWCAA